MSPDHTKLGVVIAIYLLLQMACGGERRLVGFFPTGAFDECNHRGTDPEKMRENGNRRAVRIEKILGSFSESSLYQLSSDSRLESYRFLWLRSFDRPISLRVDIKDSKRGMLTVKGGKDANERQVVLGELRQVVLGEEEINSFHGELESQGYWNLHACEELTGIDGSVWVFEALRNGRYKLVARRGETAEFRPLIKHLVQMANLNSEQFY